MKFLCAFLAVRGQEIPSVPLKELATRNIKRFLATGRWVVGNAVGIPYVQVLSGCVVCCRYASISKLALFHLHGEKQKTGRKGGMLSHYDLARAAGECVI